MVRHRLTDEQWELTEGVFPPPAKTGRPRRDWRVVLDGIFWILRTGASWRDLEPVRKNRHIAEFSQLANGTTMIQMAVSEHNRCRTTLSEKLIRCASDRRT